MPTQKSDQEFVKEGAEKVTQKDIEKVVNKSEEIKKKFTGRSLGRFIQDAQLLISVVKDYWFGKYRQVPYGAVAAIVFTLIYIFNPLDLVPDVLPIIGEVDDAAVMAACLILVEQDLHKYKDWEQAQSQS